MLTIYKYAIEHIADEVEIKMPVMAEVVHVASQAGLICLWAKVDTKYREYGRKFFIRGTGRSLESNLTYLGTAHITPFVWHVFE